MALLERLKWNPGIREEYFSTNLKYVREFH